jgi:hypothetical protein
MGGGGAFGLSGIFAAGFAERVCLGDGFGVADFLFFETDFVAGGLLVAFGRDFFGTAFFIQVQAFSSPAQRGRSMGSAFNL